MLISQVVYSQSDRFVLYPRPAVLCGGRYVYVYLCVCLWGGLWSVWEQFCSLLCVLCWFSFIQTIIIKSPHKFQKQLSACKVTRCLLYLQISVCTCIIYIRMCIGKYTNTVCVCCVCGCVWSPWLHDSLCLWAAGDGQDTVHIEARGRGQGAQNIRCCVWVGHVTDAAYA